ncbi:phage tail tape measure protein [Arcicella sp. LKC2W]|uniref:phage tail tape measure protein n=1 Tax=Arcicella sp. LKC2W TaxID=2984198 RepID=UPI002B1FBB35|nr:phage tail tape measure protein [Arcicella sp. LKC2W]MEA5459095.1 phage tail tape measure protein [Arcicella sp. LKC2W]
MSYKVEEILMRIKVDTSEGINKLGLLEESYQKLSKAQKEAKSYTDQQSIADGMGIVREQIEAQRKELGLTGLTLKNLRVLQREYAQAWQTTFTEGSPQWKQARKDYDDVSARIKEITRNQKSYDNQLKETVKAQGVEALSVQHLREYYKLLNREIEASADFESDATKKRIADAQKVDALITSRTSQIKGTQSVMEQVFGQMPAALAGGIGGGVAAFGLEAIQQIPAAIGKAIDSYSKLSDVNSDLKVSLQKSDAEVNQLNKDLKNIDTRTSNSQLRELAIIAGDLNETDGTAFVESMDKASIVFERDFSNVSELADTFGKMKGFFSETKGQTMPEFINGIGSAIKKLNDDGPATTKGIIEFTTRIGSIPNVIKPAASDVLAFAAIFEEAGITAERSSSGLINIIQVAGENSSAFAKILRMTTKEFKDLYNQNPTEVIVKLAQRLRNASGTELIESLQKLKLTSKESVDVIGNMINNLGKFQVKQKISSEAVAEATRLQEVFNEKNTNTAAQLAKAGKIWDGWMASIGKGLTTYLKPFTDLIILIGDKTENLTEKYQQQNQALTIADGKLKPLMDKYKELQPKIADSAESQRQFNEVIRGIGEIVPDAITQVDNFGRALSINIGLVDKFLDQRKQTVEKMKWDAVKENNETLRKLKIERASLLNTLQNPEKITGVGIGVTMEQAEENLRNRIRSRQNRLLQIDKDILNAVNNNKNLFREQSVTNTTDTGEPPKDYKFNSNLGGDDKAKARAEKAERERIKRLKQIQDDTQAEIDLRAKLVYEADIARAEEEDKQIIEAKFHASERHKQIERQFQDENGLVKEFFQLSKSEKKQFQSEEQLIEIDKNAKIKAIRKAFALEREAQLKEETNRSLALLLDARTKELNAQLNQAQEKGNQAQVFVLRQQILMENRIKDSNAEEAHYQEQKRKLKGNQDALSMLEKNHTQALLNINAEYNIQSDQLFEQHSQARIRKMQAAELERLRLAVSAKEDAGQNPIQLKIALMNEEMRLELSATDLTEQEKANIRERYRQQELNLTRTHNKNLVSTILGSFQQAFTAISGLLNSNINNRIQSEQNAYDKTIQNLEREKEAKILTDKQYSQKKKEEDAKHNEAQKKLKKEQFEANRAEQLANATMNLASQIIQVLAKPWMIPIVSALGAIQIATIATAEAPAFEEGGYTDNVKQKMYDKGPGFLARIGEKGREHITPNWQLQDPVVANIMDYVEYRRVNKITGFEAGGNTSTNSTNSNPVFSQATSTESPMLINVLTKLSDKMDNLEAKIYFGHEQAYEVEKLQKDNLQSKKSALQ